MKRNCLLLMAGLSVLLFSGCVNTVDGRHQAGVPFVADKIEGKYERPPQEIWTAAKDALSYSGKLYSEDRIQNTLEASVDTRTVWVKVEPLDEKVTLVTVQARTKAGGTDRPLAAYIKEQIAVRLASGNLTPGARAPRSP